MIVCIVGPSCAGKTTGALRLYNNFNHTFIEASDYMHSRHEERGQDLPIMDFVKEEFDRKGKDTIARELTDDVEPQQDTVICGYRTLEEVEFTLNRFSDVAIIGIYSNSLLRYQRKLRRDNPESSYTYMDFVRKDLEEFKFGILDILDRYSECIILNEGSIDMLYSKIDKRMRSISPD